MSVASVTPHLQYEYIRACLGITHIYNYVLVRICMSVFPLGKARSYYRTVYCESSRDANVTDACDTSKMGDTEQGRRLYAAADDMMGRAGQRSEQDDTNF